MAERSPIPAPFEHLTDLAADALGGFVLFATDDYFAEKENLLKASAPLWLEGKYTDKGKWMDGWESQRRRTPGHDWAVVRLGIPGSLHGFVVDTTHFKGNAPEAVQLEGLEAEPLSPVGSVLEHAGWFELTPKTPVRPDFANVLELEPSRRVTHVRLRIFPDGGVARLRAFGRALPHPRTFWRPGSIDLAAVENGGTIAAVSDQFFGPPSNLLLPGRGVNMGDGWETKRRRTPGSDWCVVRLARRGVLHRVELDTHFFKGNAPQHVLVESLDEHTLGAARVAELLRAPEGWTPVIDQHPLEQHRRHELDPVHRLPVTHLRVHIFPHGGVNRMRFFGHALDTEADAARVRSFDEAGPSEARELARSFCGSHAFGEELLRRRPFGSARRLFEVAEEAWWATSEADRLEAFAAHPRLGSTKRAESASAQSATWSEGEQRGAAGAKEDVLARLASQNEAYFEKFGFVFLLFASGRTAAEMLSALEARIGRTRGEELATAAREQWKITRLRIEKWLLA